MHLSDFFIGKPGPGSISEALLMQLAGDCGAECLDAAAGALQRRLDSATGRGDCAAQLPEDRMRPSENMLKPQNYARFRKRAKAHKNRAVFEIPDFMEQVMSGAQSPLPAEPLRA